MASTQTQVLAGLLAVLLGISLYAHLGVRDDGKCPFSGSSEMPAEGHPATGTASSTPRQQSSAQERSGRSADAPRVWLPDELSEYDGSPDKPIMLAVLGQVFDVSKGRRFYGKEAGPHYNFFAGKDGSRAFTTGEFEGASNGLRDDDVSDLTQTQVADVEHWRKFFHENYKFVGVLHQPEGGTYYDVDGQPTALLGEVEKVVAAADRARQERDSWHERFPSCNSRWAQGSGGEVWCDGTNIVPRLGKMAADDYERCGCYDATFAAQHAQELHVYEGCDPRASRCRIPA